MKNLKPKYEEGEMLIILPESDSYIFLTSECHENWQEIKAHKIEKIFLQTDEYYQDGLEDELIRYRLQGLWFNQNEVKKVTPEQDPEYFL